MKLNISAIFFTSFLKCKFTLEHFEEKDGSHIVCLSEIIDCEIHAYVKV